MHNILITGAASGIGAATARLFHARGWKVGLVDVNQSALSALAAELNGAWYATLDVTDGEAVQRVLADFCAAHDGRLRLLFNCAGVLRYGAFEDVVLEVHVRTLQINVIGLLQMCHGAFAYLKATPGAQVINMSSASAMYGSPGLASYSASKFAVRGLTEALELEWRQHGIRVGDLMPPFVRTPMITDMAHESPTLQRLGVRLTAEEVAAAVWRQAQNPVVHRPVHWSFRLLYAVAQILPASLMRWFMGRLSQPA
ncbi:3-hydroxybutyrate dehydrogenase [compost metagenome]